MMLKNFLDPRRSKRLISPWWLEFKLKKTAFAAEHMEKSHATYLVIGAATYDLSGKKKNQNNHLCQSKLRVSRAYF